MRKHRVIFPVLLLPFVIFAPLLLGDEGTDFFESKIRPVLVDKCYKCHSADKEKRGELVLDTKGGWEVGGDSGPAVVPGKPDASLLIEAVRFEGFEMPPDKKLSDAEIDIFVKWIKMGAPDPRTEGGPAARKEIDIEEGSFTA